MEESKRKVFIRISVGRHIDICNKLEYIDEASFIKEFESSIPTDLSKLLPDAAKNKIPVSIFARSSQGKIECTANEIDIFKTANPDYALNAYRSRIKDCISSALIELNLEIESSKKRKYATLEIRSGDYKISWIQEAKELDQNNVAYCLWELMDTSIFFEAFVRNANIERDQLDARVTLNGKTYSRLNIHDMDLSEHDNNKKLEEKLHICWKEMVREAEEE